MSMERRFERIQAQNRIRTHLENVGAWSGEMTGRVFRTDVGEPFERRVGAILRDNGFSPLVEHGIVGRMYRVIPTETFGGVRFASHGRLILEIDGLYYNNASAVVVESKTGGPCSAFEPSRIALIHTCVQDVWRSLRNESPQSIAMTVVVPSLEGKMRDVYERLGAIGADVVQVPLTIHTFREQVLSCINRRRR